MKRSSSIRINDLFIIANSTFSLSAVLLNELNDNSETVFSIKDKRCDQPGNIQLKKFPSDGTTIPHIKQFSIEIYNFII